MVLSCWLCRWRKEWGKLEAGESKEIDSFFEASERNTALRDFPCGSAGKESNLQCRRPAFDPWVGKIPWRREILWPGEFYGLYSPWRHRVRHFPPWHLGV